ncbi:predicted protein [Aspergillus nidulans FGSC A4]|nr:predicted protein [Aspergillus nidulans FGSC A4]|eukprot:XP_663532.1 predicted protein [Aspergillus nidulans FGSC A4]
MDNPARQLVRLSLPKSLTVGYKHRVNPTRNPPPQRPSPPASPTRTTNTFQPHDLIRIHAGPLAGSEFSVASYAHLVLVLDRRCQCQRQCQATATTVPPRPAGGRGLALKTGNDLVYQDLKATVNFGGLVTPGKARTRPEHTGTSRTYISTYIYVGMYYELHQLI